MTAEIAILNREAVALAADSAVTITGPRGQKIFTSANKIFALSESRPVGIMIYGDAEILRVPWETVIKLYREQLTDTGFASLDEYAVDFLRFLTSPVDRFFPPDAQEEHVAKEFVAYLEELVESIDARVEEYLEANDRISDARVRAFRDSAIRVAEARVSGADPIPGAPADYLDDLRARYASVGDEAIRVVLQRLRPRGAGAERLRELLLRSYSVEGVAADTLKHHPYVGAEITSMGIAATVFPFAQAEMVVRFMEGA